MGLAKLSHDRRSHLRRAEQNHGIVSRVDLLRDDVDSQAIWRRVRDGSLEEVLPGAYRIPGSRPCWEQDLAAALTWAGPESRASHRSAAALLSLDGFPKNEIEISTTRRLARVDGVILHRTARLYGYDSMLVPPFTCTTPARTLLDLGAVCDRDRIEYALEDALRRRLTSVAALERELTKQGARGRRGTASLRTLLESRTRDYVPTGSNLEVQIERFLRSLQRPPDSLGLPPWQRQHAIRTREGNRHPDFAFVEHKVAVEGHSFRWHSGRKAWDSDHRRDQLLRSLGWEILYISCEDLRHRRQEVRDNLCRALSRRGWDPGPSVLWS